MTTVNPGANAADSQAAAAASAPKQDSLSVLKALAEASAVFVALTFVGGRSYLASYYKTFGLDPLELDVSVPVVSTAGVLTLHNALQESGWLLLGVGAVLAGFVAALAHFSKLPSRPWVVAGFVILLFGSIGTGISSGRRTALADMLDDSRYLPRVTFLTSKLAAKFRDALPSCVVFEALYEGKEPIEIQPCRLLLHSGKMYYFFPALPEGNDAHSVNVYTIAETEIDAIDVQRGLRR